MMQSHTLATFGHPTMRSSVLSTAVLNVALRTLVHTCDYLAASVCLQTFEDCKIQVDAKTFRVVLVDLLGRVRSNLRVLDESNRWVDRFLPGLERLDPDDTRIETVGTILRVALHQMPQNTSNGPFKSATLRLPSLAAILQGGGSPKQPYDIRPLAFLLRKAAYASMDRGKYASTSLEMVDESLAELKADLVPKLSRVEKWLLKKFQRQLARQKKKAARAQLSGQDSSKSGDVSQAEAISTKFGPGRGEVEVKEKMRYEEEDLSQEAAEVD